MRVLMLGIVLAIATAVPTTSSADDQQIAEFIKTKLLQEKQRGNLFGFNVDMRVDRGTVWFKGFVSNRSQELMILRTAQLAGHLGVVQVVDDIDINQSFAETAVAPAVRQDVRQQQAVMTAIPNGQQSPQMPSQPMMQPQMMQPQMMQPQMMQPQMTHPQMTHPQMMHPQMMQQQPMQQQMMQPQMMQQPNVQQPGTQGMQQFAPAGQFAPAEQIAPPAPHRAEMPMLRQVRPDMDTTAQPVVYQEPAYMPEIDRATANYQQPAGYAPSVQQNLLNPVESPQAYYQPPAENLSPPVSIQPEVRAPIQLVSSSSQPLPFARASAAVQCGPDGGCGMMQGGPMGDCGMMSGCPSGDCGQMSGGQMPGGPMPGGGFGGADGGGFAGGDGINSDSANLPGYAWPSYAAHPNYGAVSYPKQYSPSAWPYIGPFYPYPQVPLGWRKVALEWDDGWWFLDFDDKN